MTPKYEKITNAFKLLKLLASTKEGGYKRRVENGRLVVEPKIKPRYTLAELLERCTEENMTVNTEDREWLDAKPVGKEIIPL